MKSFFIASVIMIGGKDDFAVTSTPTLKGGLASDDAAATVMSYHTR
jgi:hypothetical protein